MQIAYKNSKFKDILWWIIFVGILVKILIYVIVNQIYFTRPYDQKFFGDLYTKSQYVVGSKSEGGIGDDGLYAFAGYYYFFQGGDVTKVNFEHPPLGKYLIGLSIFLFKNENTISLIYYFLLLLITYKIARLININKIVSLLAVTVLSSDLLVLDNLIRSLLDLPFTLFFTAALYFFLKGLDKPKNYILSSFFWGCAFSVRFFPSIIFVYLFLSLIVFIFSKKNILIFLLSGIFVPLIYMINHISFFVNKPSLVEFIRHKKWMLSWFRGTVVIPGNILRNIYAGNYIDSTGRNVHNNLWNIIIPITFSSSLLTVKIKPFIKNKYFITLFGLIVIYSLYVVFLTGGVQKFIMPIYPIICILSLAFFERIYSIIIAWIQSAMKK
jgi:predicted membrane-bound dolichyl-phosphate-mannose-protein mannosyltransferase